METAKKDNPRRLRTPPFRMSHPCLPPMEPRVDEESGRCTYQLAMLFPAGTDPAPFRKCLKEAMIYKFGPDQKLWPRVKQTADAVIKDFADYNANTAKTPLPGDWEGWLLIRANAKAGPDIKQPHIVGPIRDPDGKFPVITDLRDIYGGRWARATIEAYYFDIKNKNSGVTFGLSNVQLLKADKRFGAERPAAEEDFDDAPEQWSGQGDAFESGEAGGSADEAEGW